MRLPKARGETGKPSKYEKAIVSRHSSFIPGTRDRPRKTGSTNDLEGAVSRTFCLLSRSMVFVQSDTRGMKTAILPVKKMSHRCDEFVK
jgi:hypothetical protein